MYFLRWAMPFNLKRLHESAIVALLTLVAVPGWSEIIDRVVVVVDDNFIITLSDIRKERVIETALGSDPGSDEAVANMLVDKHLVEQQIDQFRPIDIPESEVVERLRTIQTPDGVSDREIQEAVKAKLRRAAFMNQKFGQFIRVSEEEEAEYYEKILAPELQRRGEPIPPLEAVLDKVRQNLILERMVDEFDAWLAELKKRITIEKILQ